MSENRKKKLTISFVFIICSIVVTFVLGIYIFQIYRHSFVKQDSSQKYSNYYVMIVDDIQSDFWKEIYNSAYNEGKKQDVYVELLGSNLLQEYNAEELMEIAIFSKVDGIIVAAEQNDKMTSLINDAVDENIPVITLYSDNIHSKRSSFVGVGEYDLGCEYGKQILKLASQGDKNVAVLIGDRTDNSIWTIVWSGIQETISKEKTEKVNIDLQAIAVDDSSNFAAEESIRDLFIKGDLPDIIICLNEVNTMCVYQAIIDYNKVGEIDLLGYYHNDTILQGIYRSVITSTISIDTKQMGKYCVDALIEQRDLGNTSQYFMTDIMVVDKNNVSDFMGEQEYAEK